MLPEEAKHLFGENSMKVATCSPTELRPIHPLLLLSVPPPWACPPASLWAPQGPTLPAGSSASTVTDSEQATTSVTGK